MRDGLRPYANQRRFFTATFVRYGTRHTPDGPRQTVLLGGVCEERTGDRVAGHLWLTEGEGLRALGTLYAGDQVRFNARVGVYERHDVTNWTAGEADYGLFQPACWERVKEG